MIIQALNKTISGAYYISSTMLYPELKTTTETVSTKKALRLEQKTYKETSTINV